MRLAAPLAVVAAAALATVALAEPSGVAVVRVVDQYGNTVSHLVRLEVLGARAYRLNATHWAVRCNASVPARVLLYNVTVWQGALEPDRSYVVRAGVVRMVVRSPDPSLAIEVTLVGSGKTWRLVGRREYQLYPVPTGTYRVVVHGATVVERTLYFTGGVIEVASGVEYRPGLLPLLAVALVPAAAYAGYRAVKGPKWSLRAPPRPRLARRAGPKPQKKARPSRPEKRERREARPKIKVSGRAGISRRAKEAKRVKAGRGTIADLLESLPE